MWKVTYAYEDSLNKDRIWYPEINQNDKNLPMLSRLLCYAKGIPDVSAASPDGDVLTQLGNQPQRRVQLFEFIVGHVGHNYYHEPGRAAWVHTSHYPILRKGKTVAVLQRSSESHRVRILEGHNLCDH